MAPAPQPAGRPRPGQVKPIVPAIPLPYIQKRKQQVSMPNKAEEEPKDSVSAEKTTPSVDPPALANKASNSEPISDATLPTSTTPTNTSVDGVKSTTLDGQGSSGPTSSEYDAEQTPPLAPSDYNSSTSHSTHNIAPPTVSTNNGYILNTGDAVRFPKHPSFRNQKSMHHAQPSAGSLVFGGYPESNTSSPVPFHSGVDSRHNNQAFPDDQRFDSPSIMNGGPVANLTDNFIPVRSQGPPDFISSHEEGNNTHHRQQGTDQRQASVNSVGAFAPTGIPDDHRRQRQYDPSTPHSFHDSQSSAQIEVEGFRPGFNVDQYVPVAKSIEDNGHADEGQHHHHHHHNHRQHPTNGNGSQSMNMGPTAYPQSVAQAPMPTDNLDGLIGYLQSQFADPRYADYILELRYTDDRATPVQIPGHTVILARSPTLKHYITAKARDSSHGQPVKTLLLESNDRFLRSDAFWLAVQRLYGGPLLDPGAPATISALTLSQLSSGTPGTPADRFDLALGYAAAGHLLQMPPVVSRGIEVASHFVNWLTVEKALDFCLDGGLGPQWMHEHRQNAIFPNTYGPIVDILIHSTLNFLITAFPPNYEFDATVAEPQFNRRIPFVPDIRVTIPNPRLSNIQFGDHSSEDVAAQATNSPTVVLSRVLLNLPFQLLKYVLESPRLGNVHGWATHALRTKVMHAVIEEREKRRNRARDSKIIPDTERRANYRVWETVGWQESVVQPFSAGEVPTLARNWVEVIHPHP